MNAAQPNVSATKPRVLLINPHQGFSAGIPKVITSQGSSSTRTPTPEITSNTAVKAELRVNPKAILVHKPVLIGSTIPTTDSKSALDKGSSMGKYPDTNTPKNNGPYHVHKDATTFVNPVSVSSPSPSPSSSSSYSNPPPLNQTSVETNVTLDAFETLPRHLIQQGMLYEAIQVLLDEKFIHCRCHKLGLARAAKLHARDWESVLSTTSHGDSNNYDASNDERGVVGVVAAAQSETCILDALETSPEISMVEDDDDESESVLDVSMNRKIRTTSVDEKPKVDMLMDARITSMELFRQLILGFLGKDVNGMALDLPQDAPKYTWVDGGQALFILGKACHSTKDYDQAFKCYHQSLYFLFLEQGYEVYRFFHGLDESSNASLYINLCNRVHPYSDVHGLIGAVLIRIGDLYSHRNIIEPSLHAYKAAYEFCIQVVQYYFPQYEDSVNDLKMSPGEPNGLSAILSLAEACKRIGAVFILQEQYSDAMSCYERVLELQIFVLGDEHVNVGQSFHDMGVAQRHAGRWDHALKCYAKAHKIFDHSLGSEHLDTGK